MDDQYLMLSALIVSLIGLIALYLLSQSIRMPETDIAAINAEDGKVAITGTVLRSESGRFTRIILSQEAAAIIFENITLVQGQRIRIFGTLSSYGGKQEIIAEKITLVS
jgi:DNA/RNA endonuclease YhcR with UshA esterase domain